jgi:hypothetical protein
MGRATAIIALSVAAGAVALAGCATQGLDFRTDTRLTIMSPADRSAVSVPFLLEWTLADPGERDRAFAVLVDVSPPRAGAFITDLLPESQQDRSSCDATCQAAALTSRGITVTTADELDIAVLPRRSGLSDERARRHTITVIVLDEQGRRVGEVADSVDVDEVFQ